MRRRRHGERCSRQLKGPSLRDRPSEGREEEAFGRESRGPEVQIAPKAQRLSSEPRAALTGTFRSPRVLGPALQRREARGGQGRGLLASLHKWRGCPWGQVRDQVGHRYGPGRPYQSPESCLYAAGAAPLRGRALGSVGPQCGAAQRSSAFAGVGGPPSVPGPGGAARHSSGFVGEGGPEHCPPPSGLYQSERRGAGPGSRRLPGGSGHVGSWSSVHRNCRHLLCAPPRAGVPRADAEDEDGAGDRGRRRLGLLRRRLGRREAGKRRGEW